MTNDLGDDALRAQLAELQPDVSGPPPSPPRSMSPNRCLRSRKRLRPTPSG
jgi:hypothetical protein